MFFYFFQVIIYTYIYTYIHKYRYIYATAASDYVVTKFGSICTEIGKDSVIDEDECIRAATSLGKNFMHAVEDAFYPRGCYFFSEGTTYWNVQQTGRKNVSSAEICRKRGSNFKLFIN